ncbi:MAG: viroplasmin family protein [Bacteroidota bacterium]
MHILPTNIYGVVLGRMLGVFWSWDVVERLTSGYPSAKQRKYGSYGDAYRAVFRQQWTGPADGVFVCHSDGWLAFVDPHGDVPAQLAALAPVPGPDEPSPNRVVVHYKGRRQEIEINANLAYGLDDLGILPRT